MAISHHFRIQPWDIDRLTVLQFAQVVDQIDDWNKDKS